MADVPSPVGGGKFGQYVKEIIKAERAPVRQMEVRKGKEKERLKLLQDFVGKMRKLPEAYKELENFRKFREMKADWANKDVLDVTVDKTAAETGEYQVEVLQLAGRKSMISNGYESVDEEIGVGYFTYELPNGSSKSVYIGSGSNTLKDVVRAINDQKNLGIQASLINDGSGSDEPWRIVVTGKKSGTENDLIFPDFYFLDGDFRFYAEDERAAQNAVIMFNGFEMQSQNNRFELLPGVTVNLKNAKEGEEITISITEDIEKMTGKVKALVDNINSVLEFISNQNKLDAESDTTKTLGGDTTLFTVESRIRSWVFQAFPVDPEDEEAMLRLSDIGVRFQKTGLLALDEDRFKKVLAEDFDYVSELFAGEGNFIEKVKEMTDNFIAPNTGVLGSREAGIKQRIRRIDDDIARKEANLGRREEALKRQFSQLEGMLNSMQGQQQYIAQAMGGGGIPGL